MLGCRHEQVSRGLSDPGVCQVRAAEGWRGSGVELGHGLTLVRWKARARGYNRQEERGRDDGLLDLARSGNGWNWGSKGSELEVKKGQSQ